LKATKQREEIFNTFLRSPGHRNLSQIYAQVVKTNPRIGFTTVYRTMKLLTRLGLAAQRKFADGETRYEPVARGEHHDHLICVRCGKIIEFEDDPLETLQKDVAERYRFTISSHRLEIYGLCRNCNSATGPKDRG
jgi:Fur family transcriptional regulator, ferric uptake regulator